MSRLGPALVAAMLVAPTTHAANALTEADVRAIVAEHVAAIEAAHEQRLLSAGWTPPPSTDGVRAELVPAPPESVELAGRYADSLGVAETVGPATLDRDVGSGMRAEVTAGSDSSRASVRAVWDHSQHWDGTAAFTTTSLTASAPLEKSGSGQTSLATLDALSNGFELGLTVSRYRMRGLLSPFDRSGRLYPRIREICEESGAKQCDDDQVAQGLQAKGKPELLAEFLGYFQKPQAMDIIWGAKAKVGQSTFEYFLPPSFDKNDTTKLPWSAGLYYALVPLSQRTLYSFGLDYQESYKAPAAAVACPLPGAATFLQCVTGSLSAPAKKEKHLASIEMRSLLDGGSWFPAGVGVSLKFTHDFKNDESGADLPLYLFRGDKGFLSGGIRVGWTSTEQFNGGVFVGTDFGVLP